MKCCDCKEDKPEEDFWARPARKRQRNYFCKECGNRRQSKRRGNKSHSYSKDGLKFNIHSLKTEEGFWKAWTLDVTEYGLVRESSVGENKKSATQRLINSVKRLHRLHTDIARNCEYCEEQLIWREDEHYFFYKKRKYCNLVCSGKGFGMKRVQEVASRLGRKCGLCGDVKPISDFSNVRTTKTGTKKYGYCKSCARDYNYGRRLSSLFSLTFEEYEKMLSSQGGNCAVCHNFPKTKRLSVDHDHKTGLIRGLLCHICNKTLGALKDKPELLLKLIEYLREPPAPAVLGEERFGRKGRTTNKAKKKKVKK